MLRRAANFGVIGTLLLLLPLTTQAANPAAGVSCDLSAGAQKLTEIQSAPAVSYLDGVRLELQARKDLLYSVIGCLVAETDGLKLQVEELEAKDTANIKSEILAKIEDSKNFLEREKRQIQNLGIQGSKNLAREIKNWKDTTYSQLQNEANNLKIWNENQTLFETAENRLKQIQQTVRLLKLLENDEIRSMYEKSDAGLRNAGNLHRQALRNMKEYRSPEEISSSLKISLEALSQTYKNFLNLSQAVKKILPL